MKITDLAALVAVRNHILTVINDSSVTKRDEFKILNQARINLDKKFVQVIKETPVEALLPNELTIVKVGGNGYTPTAADLEAWREIFENSKNDPDFKIFTHDAVSVTQLEVGPNSEIRVRPAVEPRSLEVTPNVSITKKGQLTLPLGKSSDDEDIQTKILEQAKEAIDGIAKVAGGDIDKLENGLDKLADEGVKITPAIVEKAAEPIKAPEEKKRKVIKKAKTQPTKKVEDEPEFQEALKREKEALKKQGRSNTKVKKADDSESG